MTTQSHVLDPFAAGVAHKKMVAEFAHEFRLIATDLALNFDQKVGYLVACMGVDNSTPSGWTSAERVPFAKEVLEYLEQIAP